jgi:molecular chaperone DnaJ
MAQDYYDLLGIRRDASADDVRRAYRLLAKQHHPDVNHDDPEADRRFQAINEAYEVLRDPEKRSVYDRFGAAGVRGVGTAPGGGATYPDFGDLGGIGDLFEQFLGFGARSRSRQGARAEQGTDVRTRVKLTFEEAVFGTTRPVEVVRREACEACRGSGAAPDTRTEACTSCQGTGQVRQVHQTVLGSFVNIQTCPVCRGEGQVITHPCAACDGAGQVRRTRTLDVDIPPGVDAGLQVRLAGEGDHGRHGGAPGDLLIALAVAPHPHFVRDGDDLHLQLQLNLADAALGAEVAVPTLPGTTTLRIPAGTQTGDTFRLDGLGVPRLRRGGRGDQVVTVTVQTPRRLNREQRDLLERLRVTLPGAEVVEHGKGGLWDRVREHFS